MKKIYLAGPVDNCTKKEQIMWRHMIKQTHPQYEYLDPMHYEVDVMRGKKSMAEVIELEKQDIINCDVLLAYPWKPGSGTAMEIMWAHCENIRREGLFTLKINPITIITVIEKDKYLSPWISHHSDIVVPDFLSAVQYIENASPSRNDT